MPDPRPEILLIAPIAPRALARMEEAFLVHKLWLAPDRGRLLAEAGPRIRALATTGSHGADRALLDALPAIEIAVVHGVGLDAIDLATLAGRHIPVTTTPGVLTTDVADLAIALLLAVCRRIAEGDRFVRSGQWAAGQRLPFGTRLTGKRAGIVGLGQIGAAIARRLAAFEVSIGYVDLAPRSDAPSSYRFFESAAALAGSSDFLIAAAAGTEKTRKIIDQPVLSALGPNGVFINVARGMLVDEPALIAALRSGAIAGAGLDVFLNEPAIAPELLALPNLVCSPHQASATRETREDMGRIVVDNLLAHFRGGPLIGRVSATPP